MELRELLVKFGFDIQMKPFNDMQKGIENAKVGIGVLGAQFLAAGGLIFGWATNAAEAAEQVGKMAIKTGMGTDAVQELSYAAKLSDVSVEEFSTSLTRFANNLYGATDGSKSIQKAFMQLGIGLNDTNGKMKTTDVLITDVADTFSKMPNGPKKTALAIDLFGRSGYKMIDMLNSGSEGLAIFREEARQSGIVLSTDQIEAGETFHKSMKKLTSVITGLKNTIGIAFAPEIANLIEMIREWTLANSGLIKTKLSKFVKALMTDVKFFFGLLVKTVNIVLALTDVFGGLQNVITGAALALGIFYGVKALSGIGMIAQSIFTIIGAFKSLNVSLLLTNALALAIPVLIGLMVVGIGLLVEDIIGFFQGKDSITERLYNFINKDFPAVAEGIRKVCKVIYDTFKWLFDFVTSGFGLLGKKVEYGYKLTPILKKGEKPPTPETFVESMAKEKTNAISTIPTPESMMTPMSKSIVSNNISAPNNVKMEVSSPINITVSGAQSPKETSDEIARNIQSHISGAFDKVLYNAQIEGQPSELY